MATSTKKKGRKKSGSGKTDAQLTKSVLRLRKEGAKWSEIGEELGITPGKAQFLKMVSEVKPADRITGRNEKELAKKIVRARDKDLLSWGSIAARAGIPEGKVKRLYDEAGGTKVGNVAQVRAGTTASKKAAPRKRGAARRKQGPAAARKSKARRKRAKDPSTSA